MTNEELKHRSTHHVKYAQYRPLAIRFTRKNGKEISVNVGCGLSLKDLALVIACYLAFYSFLVIFCAVLLKGAMDTSDDSTLLWTFNFIGMLFGIAVSVAVVIGTKAQAEKKAAEQEAEMKKMQQASAKPTMALP